MGMVAGIPILLAGGSKTYPDGSKMDVVKISDLISTWLNYGSGNLTKYGSNPLTSTQHFVVLYGYNAEGVRIYNPWINDFQFLTWGKLFLSAYGALDALEIYYKPPPPSDPSTPPQEGPT
jgi:hypothetical protein